MAASRREQRSHWSVPFEARSARTSGNGNDSLRSHLRERERFTSLAPQGTDSVPLPEERAAHRGEGHFWPSRAASAGRRLAGQRPSRREPSRQPCEQHPTLIRSSDDNHWMPYVYILECTDGSFYTGSTWNLEGRLWQHQNGLGANFTRKHRGAKLVFSEYTDRIEDAFAWEKQIQGWSRAKKRALIEARVSDLPALSRRKPKGPAP